MIYIIRNKAEFDEFINILQNENHHDKMIQSFKDNTLEQWVMPFVILRETLHDESNRDIFIILEATTLRSMLDDLLVNKNDSEESNVSSDNELHPLPTDKEA